MGHIPISQEEIDGPAYLVDSSIQVEPLPLNLYICLVHPPATGRVYRLQRFSNSGR